jgi:hypothetical protein
MKLVFDKVEKIDFNVICVLEGKKIDFHGICIKVINYVFYGFCM